DDDRVVTSDEVADALAVGEPFGLVVHPAGEVVEQAVGDFGWQPGDEQLRGVVCGQPDGVGERGRGVALVFGGQDVHDRPAGRVDDLFLTSQEVVDVRHGLSPSNGAALTLP